jgi:ribosome-associated toxin RatA of RatAB toxin-antitoxin module
VEINKSFKSSSKKMANDDTVSKTIDIKEKTLNVFTYFARPEHISDQFLQSEERVGMTVVPMDVKAGMGVGTTFRVIGDFDGKRLEWDCETTEFIPERRVAAKMIKGPFKKWEIAVDFQELGEKLTKVTMTVNYDMPFGPLGAIMDKAKFSKLAEKGMETALYRVRGLLEGNGSIPVYITLDAYRKLLAEKEKMNNAPVSTVLTKILEKYSQIETAKI